MKKGKTLKTVGVITMCLLVSGSPMAYAASNSNSVTTSSQSHATTTIINRALALAHKLTGLISLDANGSLSLSQQAKSVLSTADYGVIQLGIQRANLFG